MWIFMNDSFLSIVQDKNTDKLLLVRARRQGDIEKVFPKATVFENLGSDYGYRAWVGRTEAMDAMRRQVEAIDYDNFKDSIPKDDSERKWAYMGVWEEMMNFQDCFCFYRDSINNRDDVVDNFDYEFDNTPLVEDYRSEEYYNRIFLPK